MALIKCPECDLQVSDRAIACPHCGYPLQTTAAKKQRTKQRRRKKLPNGFGQIFEIKTGNLSHNQSPKYSPLHHHSQIVLNLHTIHQNNQNEFDTEFEQTLTYQYKINFLTI